MTDFAEGLRSLPSPPTLFAQSGAVESSVAELGQLPVWILGGYLVLLLILGLVGWMKSHAGEEDYYLAGRGQGWVVSSVTIMATFFSSFALLGAPGMVYKEGVMFALYSLNVPVAGVCVYLIGSRIWKAGRAFHYVTPGDMVADYYGDHSRAALKILVAIAGLLYVIPYVVMQIKAGGIISKELLLFGTPQDSFFWGAIVLAAITMIYIMVGGMRSVAWTDVVQGLLLISGMLIAGFAMLEVFNGPAEFGRQITASLPDRSQTLPGTTGHWPWQVILSVCILGSSGSMVQPAQWMRFYSARSPQILKRAAVIFAVVLTSCFILGVMLVGMAGQARYPLTFTHFEKIENGPPRASIAIPAELAATDAERFPRAAYTTREVDGKEIDVVEWSWQGRNFIPMSDADKQALLALSDDAGWREAVEGLHAQSLAGPEKVRPAAASHADVAEFDSILVKMITTNLKLVWGTVGAVIASLIIVAIMAASMSTADSNLHALSAVTTRDVYDSFIRPEASEKERVWVGRTVIALATVAAVLLVVINDSDKDTGILKMIADLGLLAIGFSAQLLPVVLDMCFIRKGTGTGAAVGLSVGLVVTFLFSPIFASMATAMGDPAVCTLILQGKTVLMEWFPMHSSYYGLLFNVPLFAVVSLVTRKPNPEKVRAYATLFASKSAA